MYASAGAGIGWSGYSNVGNTAGVGNALPQAPAKGTDFAQQIGQYVNQVNDMQLAADRQASGLVLGDVRSMHAVMIAGEEANLALSTVLQARNKALESYHEIMRMQV